LKIVAFSIIVLSIIQISYAQISIAKIESLYNQGQYQQVVDVADSALRSSPNLPDSILTNLYTYQAFSYVALDKKDQAINIFRYLLIINPILDLDPKFISPKIIEAFEEAKRLKGDTLTIKPTTFIPVQNIVQTLPADHDIRMRMIRSLLYPGLGQLYQHKKAKGYIFLTGETISLAGLVTSYFLTNSAHQKYLNNRNITQMDNLYNNYAQWYKIRVGFTFSSIGLWLLNYIDATISK
jgi:tetratricopeptide (TPR) repeat protein